MMQSESKPVLSKITFVDHACLLNGKKDCPIPLDHNWNAGILQSLVTSYCQEYDIDFVSENHVRDIVNHALIGLTSGKQRSPPAKDGPTSISEILADQAMPESEKRALLVAEVMSRVDIRTLRDTELMLWYEAGIYRTGGEQTIKEILQAIGGEEITNARRSEVLAAIRAKTYTERSEFDKDPDVLNLKNGLLNVVTKAFREHSPEYLSMVQLPVSYDANARCPTIIRFLKETLEPEHVVTISMLLGYCLYRSAKYEKAFMFVGEGANGKSTLIRLIVALVGRTNASNVPLQALASDRFAAADLFGKMVNCFADLKADKIMDSGTFKTVVSGDRIRAQKKHQQPFEFEPYAKLIFSANQIPETDDKSYAYFRRWVIIPFNRTFEGEDKDSHLIEKLTSSQELSGLLNIALGGLQRLRRENGFFDSDVADIQDQYALGASKIRDFVDEVCILQKDIELCRKWGLEQITVPTRVLQDAFKKYCLERGSKYIDSRKFGEELKGLGVTHRQKRFKGKKEYYYFGIALKRDGVQEALST